MGQGCDGLDGSIEPCEHCDDILCTNIGNGDACIHEEEGGEK